MDVERHAIGVARWLLGSCPVEAHTQRSRSDWPRLAAGGRSVFVRLADWEAMYSLAMCRVSLAVLALLAGTAVAKAETIALLPAQGINVESGTLDAARDILEGDLVRGGRAVIPVGDPIGAGDFTRTGRAGGAGSEGRLRRRPAYHPTRIELTRAAGGLSGAVRRDRLYGGSDRDVLRRSQRSAPATGARIRGEQLARQDGGAR